MADRYKTARAFRAALEERLKQQARGQQRDLGRLRRSVAFERFLARLFATPDPNPLWLLKGGYAFELRLPQSARTTKDIDLTIPTPSRLATGSGVSTSVNGTIRERLQDAVERDVHDWFHYRISAPIADLDAAPYGGARFTIEALLDGRTFAKFYLDVGLGDAIASTPEWLTGQDLLNFAGIPPARIAVLPREQQFAEKVHAYTLPRGERMNSRVKDLVDLVMLIELGALDAIRVQGALQATFARRQTHLIPGTLDPPPEIWREQYAVLAAECGLDLATIDIAFAYVSAYWSALDVGGI